MYEFVKQTFPLPKNVLQFRLLEVRKMYKKNLEQNINVRLSKSDIIFLTDIAEHRNCSLSSVVRSIILDYRQSVVVLEKIRTLNEELGGSGDADTKTD